MRNNRTVRKLVGAAAAMTLAGAISGGMAAPLGVADTLPGGDATQGVDPAITSPTPTKAQLRARCIRKAQTKFGDNRPKMKAAIRKCKKKYKG
jgi:hypothetical protein